MPKTAGGGVSGPPNKKNRPSGNAATSTAIREGGATGGSGGGSSTRPSPRSYSPPTTYYPAQSTPARSSYSQSGAFTQSRERPRELTPQDIRTQTLLDQIREAVGGVPDTEAYDFDDPDVQSRFDEITKEANKHRPEYLGTPDERAELLDEATGRKLPPDVVMALAKLDVYNSRLNEVARVLSRELDPPRGFYLPKGFMKPQKGDAKHPWELINPRTGTPLSAKAAKQVLRTYEKDFWTELIRTTTTDAKTTWAPDGRRGRTTITKAGEIPVDPVWVGAGFGVLADHIGDQISFKKSLGVALSIAANKVNTTLMGDNLDRFLDAGYPVKKAVAAAQATAEMKRQVVSIEDAHDAYASLYTRVGEDGDETAYNIVRSYQSIQQDLTSSDPAVRGEALRALDYFKEQASNEALDEGTREAYQIAMQSPEEGTMSMSDRVQKLGKEYEGYAEAIMRAEMYKDRTNQEGLDLYSIPILGPKLEGAMELYNAWDRIVFDRVRRGAADIWNEGAYTYAKLQALIHNDPKAMKDARNDHGNWVLAANRIGQGEGQQTFTEFLENQHGFDPAMAFVFDMAATWFVDPLIVGGKAFKTARVARMSQKSWYYNNKIMQGIFKTDYTRTAIKQLTQKRRISLGGRTIAETSLDEALEAAARKPTLPEQKALAYLASKKTHPANLPRRQAVVDTLVTGDNAMHPGFLGQGDFVDLYNRTQKKILDAAKSGKAVDEATQLLWDQVRGKGKLGRGARVDDPVALHKQMQLSANSDGAWHWTRMNSILRPRWKHQSVDPRMLDYIFRYVEHNKGLGRAVLKEHVDEIWRAAAHGVAPQGSIGFSFLDEMEKLANTTPSGKANLAEDDIERIWQIARAEDAQALVDDAVNVLPLTPLMSIPKPHFLTTVVKMTGDKWKLYEKLGKSRIGIGGRALRTRYRDPYLNLEDRFSERIKGLLQRSREFSADEVAAYERQALTISKFSTAEREAKFVDLAEEIEKEIWKRTGNRMGLRDDVVEALYKNFDEAQAGWGGTRPSSYRSAMGDEATNILFETQKRNRLLLSDPVAVRTTLHSHLRASKLLSNHAKKIFGAEPKFGIDDLVAKWGQATYIDKEGIARNVGRSARSQGLDLVKRGIDGFYRAWKPLVVVTPRYVGRVVMTNETARYIADTSIIGRMMAGKMWNKAMNEVDKLLDGAGGVSTRASTTFYVDAARSKSLSKEISEAGFNSVDEASYAARRWGRGQGEDPRLNALTQDTRDILRSAKLEGGFSEPSGVFQGKKWVSTDNGYTFKLSEDGVVGDAIGAENPLSLGKSIPKGLSERLGRTKGESVRDAITRNIDEKGEMWVYDQLDDFGYDAIYDGQTKTARIWDREKIITDPDSRLKVTYYHRRPGEILDDARVKPGLSQSEFFETFERVQRSEIEAIQNGRWGMGAVDPRDPMHTEAWAHQLNNTIGRSASGRIALLNLSKGGNHRTAVAELKKWATTPEGKNIMGRMSVKNTEKWAEDVVNEIELLTFSQKEATELVQLALNHTANPKAIANWLARNKIPDEALPHINSYKVLANNDNVNPLKQAWDGYYKFIMQDASNRIVRQPFFKKHMAEAEQSLSNMAVINGHELTAEMRDNIRRVSREYAVQRTQDIMFDFAEQSRFAELFHYVAPFAQPFFEEYTVWGKLLLDNPAMAGAMMKSFETARETGLIEKDDLTGDWQFKFPGFLGANIFNALLPTEGGILPGYSLMGNIGSLNMFTQNILQVPVGETGQLPVPLPGFNTPVQWGMQQIADAPLIPDWLKPNVAEWSTQYGQINMVDLIPKGYSELISGFAMKFLGWQAPWDDAMLTSITNEFIKESIVRGTDIQDIMEAEGVSYDKARQIMVDKARDNAGLYLASKGLARLFLPTSFQIESPLEEYASELRGLYQEMDFASAVEEFKKRHQAEMNDPALAALTISETMWVGEESVAMRNEVGPVSLPANYIVNQVMQDESFRKYMLDNPTLAFAILPDEVWDAEFDRGAYFEQIEEGWRAPKDSYDFLDDISERLYLDQYSKARQAYALNQTVLENRGFLYDSVTAQTNDFPGMDRSTFEQTIDELDRLYEGAGDRIRHAEGIGVDMATMGQIHEVLKTPIARSTELGQASWKWLKGAQEILEDMYQDNVYNLEGADSEPYVERVDALREEILQEHPSFSRVYDAIFSGWFNNVDIKRTKLGKVSEQWTPQEEEAVKLYDRSYGRAWAKAGDALDGDDAIPQYLKMRRLSYDSKYNDPQDTQELWWKFMVGDHKQREFKLDARVRPFPFMSVFDRNVLGIETNKGAEQRWLTVGDMEWEITKIRKSNPNVDTSSLYAQRDAKIRQMMKTNKVFRKQIEQANQWGFQFFHKNPWLDEDTEAGRNWIIFKDMIHDTQRDADRLGILGDEDYDGNKGQMYKEARSLIGDEVEEMFERSPMFERQWRTLEQHYNGDLMEYFMPVWNFKLGGS